MNDTHRLPRIQHVKLMSSYQHVKFLGDDLVSKSDPTEHAMIWLNTIPLRRGVLKGTAGCKGCEWTATGDKEEVRRSFNDEHVK